MRHGPNSRALCMKSATLHTACATTALYSRRGVSFPRTMVSALSLSNGLTLLFAALCLWTMAVQSRGGMTSLGRLALPGGFALLATLMLLAGVFEANILFDVLWLAAFVVGSVIGRIRGWMLPVRPNKESGLVALPATIDGVVVAAVLAIVAGIDFASSMLGEAIVEPGYIAAASALCAGFLGYRVLVIALRAVRPARTELSRPA